MRNPAMTKRFNDKADARFYFQKRLQYKKEANLQNAIVWNKSPEKTDFIIGKILSATHASNQKFAASCVKALESRYSELLDNAGIRINSKGVNTMANKQQHQIALTGVDHYGNSVQSNNSDAVESFMGNIPDHADYFKVDLLEDKTGVLVTTPKGEYGLRKNPNQNIYQGEINNTKVHVILKKIVGKLIYWS